MFGTALYFWNTTVDEPFVDADSPPSSTSIASAAAAAAAASAAADDDHESAIG